MRATEVTFTALATFIAVPFATATLLPSASSLICCGSVWLGLGNNKVFWPKTTKYEARMDSYWSLSAALDPWCVVQPANAKDVSVAIKLLTAAQCTFGVRGGGHGSFAGSNSVSNGVTIDFGSMRTTTYNPTTKLASIQPGGNWQSVYDTLAPYGVTVTGGRAGTVGVGGFITGGGNSFHAASNGFACDNVANFEIVLASGEIVNANSKTNSDLWVALKGSGANFGLITRFDMYVIEFPDAKKPVIWGGNLLYNLSSGPAIIDAMVDFSENVHKNENNSAIVYWAYVPAIGGMIANVAIENTVGLIKPAELKLFYDVPGITADTTKVDKMSAITYELGAGQPPGLRNIWFTAAFANDARIMNYAVEKFYALNVEFDTLLTPEAGFNSICMFQPISKSIVEKGIKNGGNILGLDEYIKKGNGQMFLASLGVNGAENEAVGYLKIKAYTEDVEAYAASLGLAWDWKYLNYAAKDQDPISTYGAAAIAKLKAASKKYDPKGVFQKLRLSGFKIPV